MLYSRKTPLNLIACVFLACAVSGSTAIAWQESNQPETLKPILGETGFELEEMILAKLSETTDLDCFEMRFEDVLQKISSKHKVQVVLNESAADNNLDSETLITLKLDNISLRSALRLMLAEYQCQFIVKDEMLFIVSDNYANSNPVGRYYDCRALINNMTGDKQQNTEKLVHLIQSYVHPNSWAKSGGPGTVSEIEGLIFVRQTSINQHDINNLINTLAKKLQRDVSASQGTKPDVNRK